MNIFNTFLRLLGFNKSPKQTTPPFNRHYSDVGVPPEEYHFGENVNAIFYGNKESDIVQLDENLVEVVQREYSKGNIDAYFLTKNAGIVKMLLDRRLLRFNECLSITSLTDEELQDEWDDFVAANKDSLNYHERGKVVTKYEEDKIFAKDGFTSPLIVTSTAGVDLLASSGNKKVFVDDVSFNHEPFHLFNHISDTTEDTTIVSTAQIKRYVESLSDENNIKKAYQAGLVSDIEIAALIRPLSYRTEVDPAAFKSLSEAELNIYGDKDDYKPFPDLLKDDKK